MAEPPDVFSWLVESISDHIAQRVVQRVDEFLAERSVSPDAYRVPEAAQALGLSQSETKRLIARGELGTRRVGRAVLIPREAITVFLANPRTNGRP